MSALVGGAKQARRRSSDVSQAVAGLEQAVTAARGRLGDAVVDQAAAIVHRVSQRLRLSADHTVVALAGATGSGKSSLFNRLAGLDLAAVGVRRPTTSSALACIWGADGAGELLDWLGIPRRHQVARDSRLDGSAVDGELQGLVLLDLPDHDSTEVSHHVEVDRLVARVDVLMWVLDPQKYADAAVHDRYLRPLAAHADIVMVVLNHVDELPAEEVGRCLADVDRLLAEDGLSTVEVLPTSARTGDGVDLLRQELVDRVRVKRAATARLVADVHTAAVELSELTGDARPGDVARAAKRELVGAFADAAGVPVVVGAVKRATTVRARRATGWPVTAWLSRFRPDPLKRLHLDLGARGKELTGLARSSLPKANPVQRARVDQTVRAVVDRASEGLPAPWKAAVRRASVSRLDDVGDALDHAVVSTDLGVDRIPRWWGAVRLVQWLLLGTGVVGGLWLLALFGIAYLRLPEPPTPEWRGIAVPTLLLLVGALGGLALALVSRWLAAWSARRRAKAADRRLRVGIAEVVERLVIGPIDAELDAYRACREGIARARR